MYEKTFEESLEIDRKVSKTLKNIEINKKLERDFPELSQILNEPLPPLNEISSNRFFSSRLDPLLLKEWANISNLLYLYNSDRLKLRDLSFELMSTITKGIIPSPNLLLGKNVQIHHELLKVLNEKQRNHNDMLEKTIQNQNKIIKSLQNRESRDTRRTFHTPNIKVLTPYKQNNERMSLEESQTRMKRPASFTTKIRLRKNII